MKFLLTLLALSSTASAATQFLLPNHSESGFWNLNQTHYNTVTSPAYPVSGATSTPWGGPIPASATSATFTRVSGGAYFIGSGSGLYGSQSATIYQVSDNAPISDLANLIFQARINLLPTSVTLTLNGSNSAIAAHFFRSVPAGSGSFGPINDFAWQWDLNNIADPINSYQITIEMPANSLIYGNAPELTTITAGDTFLQVIPEPSSALLVIAVAGFTLVCRRRA